jgi:hypothetical protein
VEYQPLSDPAQLRVLEGLTHLLLHGVLLVIAVAAVVLLCLYLSELRLPQRRPSEVAAGSSRRCEEVRGSRRRECRAAADAIG